VFEHVAADMSNDLPPPGPWLASDGSRDPPDSHPAFHSPEPTDPPSASKALVWTILAAFWLWVLLPVAIHYTRKARMEVAESDGRYVWSRSLLHRPVLLWLVVFGCGMALIFVMAAIGAYGD